MEELLILFMITSILELVFIFDFKGNYERKVICNSDKR